MTTRREFIMLLSGTAATWPVVARAQQPGRTYRLSMLAPSGRDAPPVVAFFEELRRSGFIEGQNLTVTGGGFGVSTSQYTDLAAAMVQSAPDVIVTDAGAGRILKQLTRTIPMVAMGEDIVADGLVDSLARPSGNITGVSILSYDLDGKRQDLLLDAMPRARHVGALVQSRSAPTPSAVQGCCARPRSGALIDRGESTARDRTGHRGCEGCRHRSS